MIRLDSVRAVQTLQISIPITSLSKRTSTTIVSTASSDGKIHVYDLASLSESTQEEVTEITPVVEYDSKGTRLTCLTLADGGNAEDNGKTQPTEHQDNEEEEEEDDEYPEDEEEEEKENNPEEEVEEESD